MGLETQHWSFYVHIKYTYILKEFTEWGVYKSIELKLTASWLLLLPQEETACSPGMSSHWMFPGLGL